MSESTQHRTSAYSRNEQTGLKNGRASDIFLFARNFLRHPNMIGSLFPTSPFVVRTLLKQVDWSRARVIVEYGPGLGAFTRKILDRMRPDAQLVAFELNKEFCGILSRSITDPRFHLVQDSAVEMDSVLDRLGLGPADCVISGIPFRTLPEPVRCEIVRKTHSALSPDGRFLVYQVSDAVRPHLKREFGSVQEELEWLNFLPFRLYYCDR